MATQDVAADPGNPGPHGGAPRALQINTLRRTLLRRADQHPTVATIIDIGASNSQWSRAADEAFPGARFHLLEANPAHELGLRSFVAERPGRATYELAAAGPEVGEGWFHFSEDPFGGVVVKQRCDERCRRVPITTVDAEVAKRALPGAYFLKFDTHGYELEILAGAPTTLAQTELIQMEVYNFGRLRFAQMCAHMEGLGFRCIDASDFMWRPGDGSLWQLDLFFAPKTHTAFRREDYF